MNPAVFSFVIELCRPSALCKSEYKEISNYDLEFWLSAIRFAKRIHSILPFAVSVSRSTAWKNIPEQAQAHLEHAIRKERMILAILDQEMEVALHSLTESRIPVIVLKGMDLGRRYYPERIFRPMTDVDLLVPSDQFMDSLRALGHAGFRVVGLFPNGRFRVELSRKQGGPVIEVHKYLLSGDTDESISRVWSHSIENDIPGLSKFARALTPQDNLLYLVKHAAIQHALESPVWLNDLHFLIQSEDFMRHADWDQIIWNLANDRALCAGWFVFHFLSSHWDTHISAEALESVGKKMSFIRKAFLRKLVDPGKWFRDGRKDIPWLIRSRFLLRDNAFDAIKYGIRRQAFIQNI